VRRKRAAIVGFIETRPLFSKHVVGSKQGSIAPLPLPAPWSELASNSTFRNVFTWDRYDELVSLDLGGSCGVRVQLLCKCIDDPHSQSLTRAEIKVGW
jgi:hypothetical protein